MPWATFWHFQCEKCSEKFMYRSTWSNHRVRCIEGPDGMNKFRKFTCRFCSSSFLARDHLRYFVLWLLLLFTFTCKPWIHRQHERIHTGEKPWKCDQCSERFQYRLKSIAILRIIRELLLSGIDGKHTSESALVASLSPASLKRWALLSVITNWPSLQPQSCKYDNKGQCL